MVLPVPSPERLQELPLRTAAALATFVAASVGADCRIKWPNDVLDEEGRSLPIPTPSDPSGIAHRHPSRDSSATESAPSGRR